MVTFSPSLFASAEAHVSAATAPNAYPAKNISRHIIGTTKVKPPINSILPERDVFQQHEGSQWLRPVQQSNQVPQRNIANTAKRRKKTHEGDSAGNRAPLPFSSHDDLGKEVAPTHPLGDVSVHSTGCTQHRLQNGKRRPPSPTIFPELNRKRHCVKRIDKVLRIRILRHVKRALHRYSQVLDKVSRLQVCRKAKALDPDVYKNLY